MRLLQVGREEDLGMFCKVPVPCRRPALWRADDEQIRLHPLPSNGYPKAVPANRVKIFGERNTGTNALARIIRENSAAMCLPGTSGELSPIIGRIGNTQWLPARRLREQLLDSVFTGCDPLCVWKHCATNFADAAPFDDVLVLFTVRHPASWLLSLFKHPYARLGPHPRSLAEFLNSRWKTVARERLGGAAFRPLELLQAKLDSYLSFAAKLMDRGIPHRIVRFEDLILQQPRVYSSIASEIEGARGDFEVLRTSTKDPSKTLDDYRDYYGKEKWRDELIGLEAPINDRLDWVQLGRFGYEKL
jgi:hypothetical protein